MKLKLLLSILLLSSCIVHAQSYEDDLFDFRENYINSLLTRKPILTAEQASYLRFYKVDRDYRVKAVFVPAAGTPPFPIATRHGGIAPPVKEYGYVYFKLKGAAIKLYVLQLLRDADIKERPQLFIPFTDATNYKETFGGGRYLDISVDDIQDNNFVTIDFNKCYNPHTAYEKGYPYIIPPHANMIKVDIKAGEKIFGKDPGY